MPADALRFLLTAVCAALVHEAGHLGAAKLCGIPLRRGRGGTFGVRLTFDFSRAGYGREALVHLGGPAAGILAAVAAASSGGENGIRFACLSAAMAVFNLLPMEHTDGGGALACLCWSILKPGSAPAVLAAVSFAVRAALWLLSLRLALTEGPNVGLLFFYFSICVFIFKLSLL